MQLNRSTSFAMRVGLLCASLVVIGLVSALAQGRQMHGMHSGGEGVITDAAAAADLPITLEPFHAFLKVSVNGSEPLDFVFDTGAGASVISSRVTEMLGIKTRGSFDATGAGEGGTRASMASGVTYTVAGAELRDQNAISMPLDVFEDRFGRKIDGIIGRGFLDAFVVEIDYAESRMRFYDPNTYEYNGDGTTIPITLTGGHSHVEARITLPGREPTEDDIELMLSCFSDEMLESLPDGLEGLTATP